MPCSLHPSSQGNVSLISCVRRTWKWLYWWKSTEPRMLSWALAKNLGKGVRKRKTHREMSPGCSHSFWYFAAQRFNGIGHLEVSSTLGQTPHSWPGSLPFYTHKDLSRPQQCAPRDPAGETDPESSTFLLSNLNLPPAGISVNSYSLIVAGGVTYNQTDLPSAICLPFQIFHPRWSFPSSPVSFQRWEDSNFTQHPRHSSVADLCCGTVMLAFPFLVIPSGL